MSFIGQFAGRTAQNTQDTLQKWRELMLKEEQVQNQQDQFEKTHALRRQELALNTQQFDWRKSLDTMTYNLQRDEFNARQLGNWWDDVSAMWPGMTPSQRYDVLAEFENSPLLQTDAAARYMPMIRATVEDTMSPQEARGIVFEYLNQPYGTRTPSWVVDQALAALENDPSYADIKADVDARGGAENAEEAETARANAAQRDYYSVAQAAADVAATEAGAAVDQARVPLIGAQTQAVLKDIENSEAMQPLIEENQRLINEGLRATNFDQWTRNSYLDQSLSLGLQQMALDVERGEIDVRILNATIEDTIAQIAAQSDLTVEQARHAVATGTIRDALVSEELAGTQAQTDLIRATIEQTLAQTEGITMANVQTRNEILIDLVESGSPELLGEVGMEVLTPIYGEERAREIVDAMSEDAVWNRTAQERGDRASLLLAEAEVEYVESTLDDRVLTVAAQRAQEEWTANNMERVYTDQFGLDEERVAISKFDAETRRLALNHQIAVAAAKNDAVGLPALPGDGTRDDVYDLIDNAGGGSRVGIQAVFGEADDLTGTIRQLQAAIESGNPMEVLPTTLQDQYGFTEEALGASIQALEAQQEARIDEAVRQARGLYTAALGYGVVMSPQELGLDTTDELDAEIWNRVMDATPGSVNIGTLTAVDPDTGEAIVLTGDEAEEALNAEIVSYIGTRMDMWAPGLAEDGVGMMAPGELWDMLTDPQTGRYTEEQMQAAGFDDPGSLAPALNDAVEQFNMHVGNAQMALSQASLISGQEYDYTDPADLAAAEGVLSGQAQRYTDAYDIVMRASGSSGSGVADPAYAENLALLTGRTLEQLEAQGVIDFVNVPAAMQETTGWGAQVPVIDFNVATSWLSNTLASISEPLNGLSVYRNRY